MRQSLAEYCKAQRKEYLLAQWDAGRNLPLTTEGITAGSHVKVWWRCEKGHRWQAAVRTRAEGKGCPICAGKVVVAGVNDLAAGRPDLAAQWDREKNAPLEPEDVSAGMQRKVWWRCEKGHSYQATIASRARGSGCPVCAGKVVVAGENDLAHAFPAIAAEWNAEKNPGITPEMVTPFSNRRVWWTCPLGHTYQAVISARTLHGSACPYCAGSKVLRGFNDLATVHPEIAAQWHPTLNGTLTPEQVTAGSSRKVWWQCGEGHVWKAVIHSRTGKRKCGCPVCAGRVKRQREGLRATG